LAAPGTANVLDGYKQLVELPPIRVMQMLTRSVKYHGQPVQLRTDNGAELGNT
jgi:hypothetical protein